MPAEKKDIQIYLGGLDEVERATGQPHELIPLEGNHQFLTTTLDLSEGVGFKTIIRGLKTIGIIEQASQLGATAIVNYRVLWGLNFRNDNAMGTPVRPVQKSPES